MSDNEYGLVMPFVVTQSQGGPYEDHSFVAGYQCGQIDKMLEILDGKSGAQFTVRRNLLPQLDLVAMRHGYKLHSDDAEHGWVFVSFTPDDTAPDPRIGA